MKAFLKTKGGFHRYMDVPEDLPVYEFAEPIDVDIFTQVENIDPFSNVTITRKTFYRERKFLNEFDEEVVIYKER